MSMRVILLIGCLVACVLTTTTVEAANCALRNPDRQVYEMFPNATSYRTIVGEVNRTVKSEIEHRLGRSLNFGDLGKHSLCIVFRDGVPLGIVHARTEMGEYGSIEFVWAMDLNMKIKDFRVQRSREKHTDEIRTKIFRDNLIGKGIHQLSSMLLHSNNTIDSDEIHVSKNAQHIAYAAVLSGAKTLIISELAFSNSLLQARLLGNTHNTFPETHKMTKFKDPFNRKAFSIMNQRTGSTTLLIDRNSLTVVRSLDESGVTLGAIAVFRTSNKLSDAEYWLTVASDGRILKVWINGDVDQAHELELPELIGEDLDGVVALVDATGNITARYVIEVLAVLAAAGMGE